MGLISSKSKKDRRQRTKVYPNTRSEFSSLLLHELDPIHAASGEEKAREVVSTIVEMVEEDQVHIKEKRSIERSLIDLKFNQTLDGELDEINVDVVRQLLTFHLLASALYKQAEWLKPMDDIVWPHIVALLTDAYHKHSDGVDYLNSDGGMYGWATLYELASHPIRSDSTLGLVHLTARLSALDGVDVDADVASYDGMTPLMLYMRLPVKPRVDVIKLLLQHDGAELNAQQDGSGWTCLYWLVYKRRLDVLRDLYMHLPEVMSSIDYSIRGDKDPMMGQAGAGAGAGGGCMTIIQLATHHCRHAANQRETNISTAILNRLQSERTKQYEAIRSLLHQCTPLKLNDLTDLTDSILPYIIAHDES